MELLLGLAAYLLLTKKGSAATSGSPASVTSQLPVEARPYTPLSIYNPITDGVDEIWPEFPGMTRGDDNLYREVVGITGSVPGVEIYGLVDGIRSDINGTAVFNKGALISFESRIYDDWSKPGGIPDGNTVPLSFV